MKGLLGKLRRLSGVGEAELVPQARLSGPIPWVIAIMVMLTVIAAAGGLALRKLASVAENELSGGVTIQIVESRPEVRDGQVRQAVQLLSALPGVTQVAAVPQQEVDALVEPWLGEETAEADIPVPALIDARLSGPVTRNRLEDLRAALRGKVPSARVDAQSTWLKPVFGALSSLHRRAQHAARGRERLPARLLPPRARQGRVRRLRVGVGDHPRQRRRRCLRRPRRPRRRILRPRAGALGARR